ncbi:MAG: class I SAM-dependent methyltransferase [Ignisphaera sp.]|uniref:Class I SAM-dependent methyltransferase n=1 Tax=Ignisphaera aggregans TaxID=334771 RepID=A0A832CPB3_9CREN
MDKVTKRVTEALKKISQVFDAYVEIAEGFAYWRTRPWQIVRLDGRGAILDLGAGTCLNGIYAYKHGGQRLLCIDISYVMSFIGRRNLIRERIPGDSIAGDMLFLPLRENTFHSIIAVASLHHIPRELLPIVLKEVKRVAVNGAIVIIVVWSWRQARFVIPTIMNVVLRILGMTRDIKEYNIPWRRRERVIYRYYRLYTLEELLKFCRIHGFKVLSHGYIGYIKNKSDNVYMVLKVVK